MGTRRRNRRNMGLRPSTHCTVPGHGTRCVVADELSGLRYPRSTEERQALAYELAADEPGRETGRH